MDKLRYALLIGVSALVAVGAGQFLAAPANADESARPAPISIHVSHPLPPTAE